MITSTPHPRRTPGIEALEARIAPALVDFTLPNLSGLNGFAIQSDTSVDQFGGVGDFNGDGFGDLAFSSIGASSGRGVVRVVYGSAAAFPASIDLDALAPAAGFSITGEAANDQFGAALAGVGDVNGDGFADLVVGAPGADPAGLSSGAAYVIFGRAGVAGGTIALASLGGTGGFKVTGAAAGDRLGELVANVGDVNGDGRADVGISAPNYDGGASDTGAVYAIFGRASGFAASIAAGTLAPSAGATR